ncbi:endolytic transglycosylase MltG [Dysgonomonas macrotermitis]|uniref:Endolytic murein transglycosylase n=1 Tax=Dysgonomonas macrotermitis TaxID=1346286 RepID=A0A1M5JE51_9BACT|nr:endolytic transglycosylase MltG [Dysgonomonas macrotermitis]SHG38791.1 UPF0755 protein [Dysgonomonas macrotermitis]
MALSKRSVLGTIVCIVILALVGAFLYVESIIATKFNIDKTVYIYVDANKDYQSILTQLDTTAHVGNMTKLKMVADYYNYKDNIRTGRYAITPDMNVKEVITMLKGGHQSPVQLKFNNIRTKEDLAVRLSNQLMLSKDELMVALNDSARCAQLGFTTETVDCMFIPNTYEVYWDISFDNLFKRMDTEYNRFWTEERRAKAKQQGLTPVEVSILAAIVEEECYFSDEYPVVAGLYLNRLRSGQLLQADPTVKYAVGDFSLKRILFVHLQADSPYNTYKYEGLPPGPIRVPSIKGIDSVLNAARHNYLYMCAKEDFSGRHNFAVTHAEHVRNANRYRAALNTRGIK